MAKDKKKISVFWFRRDLRFDDNKGLYHALKTNYPVLPLFIFDTEILNKLDDKQDARVQFIHDQIVFIHRHLKDKGSTIVVKHTTPDKAFQDLVKHYNVVAVFTNHDYEPYARQRDEKIKQWLNGKGIPFYSFKDQVIFEKEEILTKSGEPYKVFTPYKNKWLKQLHKKDLEPYTSALQFENFYREKPDGLPSLGDIGFEKSDIKIPTASFDEELIKNYDETRNFPAIDTTRLGIHLRHGTISIRKVVKKALELNKVWLSQLIWREFFMMVLYHNPQVVEESFRSKYDLINWRNNEEDFEKWCRGSTGYPIVDAGMRQLNQTGFMHNRVRMIAASFLTKHLLVDWRWGEAYFAKKLLDYELSSNNGNWQWAAGTGTDAQPYFRVFNPASQAEKFDKDQEYIKRWVPEYGSYRYPEPMVQHDEARKRALKEYKKAVDS